MLLLAFLKPSERAFLKGPNNHHLVAPQLHHLSNDSMADDDMGDDDFVVLHLGFKRNEGLSTPPHDFDEDGGSENDITVEEEYVIVNTAGTDDNNQNIMSIANCNDRLFDDYNAIEEKNRYININGEKLH